MPENGYFHQNKAISAVIQAVLSCFCMPQIRKSFITRRIHFWNIQERDKGIVLAELKRYFIAQLAAGSFSKACFWGGCSYP
jgi:hypothetical protein